ncbi:MAG TPA: MBOAT family protein [Candidatus Obscuribacterales bacterium]
MPTAGSCYHFGVVLFTSATFLFLFLPALLLAYYLARSTSLRNFLLLSASALFYVWGETKYSWLVLLLIAINYLFALLLKRFAGRVMGGTLLAVSIAVNLIALMRFKYATFFVDNLNAVGAAMSLAPLAVKEVALPLGISFFVFHCISYLVDIYRGNAAAQKNPVTMALYIGFFPQLIAGPIIRYSQICDQLISRVHTGELFAEGVERFCIGLAKKLILSNSFAVSADAIFKLPPGELSTSVAWWGAIAYTLQLYFDFSGYSDMAIGLGKMLGFKFPENFNYPYTAQSIREFWQRWHMTLSAWFRDYVYIPLGGNRHGKLRTAANLMTVFLLCGLWHGANWTFVVWGVFHGLFLALERTRFGEVLRTAWRPLRHAYTMLLVIVGWVFFRSQSLPKAIAYLGSMFGFAEAAASGPSLAYFLNGELIFLLAVGIISATPALAWAGRHASQMRFNARLLASTRAAWLLVLMIVSIAEISAGSYNPFIYFHF